MTNPRPTDGNIKTQRRNAKGHLLPKVTDTPMKPIMDALNAALRSIRENNPEVPNVVLVVGQSDMKKHGHFHAEVWDAKKAPQHEIMLSGQSLARGADDVMGTLLHECAHALGKARELKDTSRQGRYHNETFRKLANEVGIDVEKTGNIGWSKTSVPLATRTLYKQEIAELRRALKTWRKPEDTSKVKRPKTTIKIECDCRSVTVPISFWDAGGLECVACAGSFHEFGSADDGWRDEN